MAKTRDSINGNSSSHVDDEDDDTELEKGYMCMLRMLRQHRSLTQVVSSIDAKKSGLSNEQVRTLILCLNPHIHASLFIHLDGTLKTGRDLGSALIQSVERHVTGFAAYLRNISWNKVGFTLLLNFFFNAFMLLDSNFSKEKKTELTDDEIDVLEKRGGAIMYAHVVKMFKKERRERAQKKRAETQPGFAWRSMRAPSIRNRTMRQTCNMAAMKKMTPQRLCKQWVREHASRLRRRRNGLGVHLFHPLTGQLRTSALEICAATSVYR